jgi:hypothetical protein
MRNNVCSIGAFSRVTILCFSLSLSSYTVANNLDEKIDAFSSADTNTCQGVKIKAKAANVLAKNMTSRDFKLLGEAKFSVLFWDIYQSRLLTSDGQYPLSHHCQSSLFEIQYLRDISKQELLDNTLAQWQHLAIDKAEYMLYLTVLENIWPDIKAGDQLTLLSRANRTVFYFNQKKIAEIESEEFADLFLRIWLDENTSEPELRTQLLGDLI